MTEHEDRVHEMLGKIATERKFVNPRIEMEAITSEGANYTSKLYVATISGKNQDAIHTFMKVAVMGEKVRGQSNVDFYNTELFAYIDLLKDYRKIEEKNHLSEEHKLKLPIFYGANKTYMEEILVLENLIKKGFGAFDRFFSISWLQAAAAVSELAKFHALSMAFLTENPEKFEEVIKQYTIPEYDKDTTEFMLNRSVSNALEVVREENKAKFAEKLKTFTVKEYMRLVGSLRRPVLVHGDFRPSNMLYRTNDDGSIEVIIVDYQTLRGGSPVVDLYYFIFTGTDAQFRAQYYDKLLDHYYTELRAALTRLGLNPDEHYSREDFEFELREKLPYGLSVAVFTLPIVTVEAESAPKVNEDMDLSDFSIQKTGSLFPERLNGVVDDFVRWGVL